MPKCNTPVHCDEMESCTQNPTVVIWAVFSVTQKMLGNCHLQGKYK